MARVFDGRAGLLLARKDAPEASALLRRMTPETRKMLDRSFADWAVHGQLPPGGDWRVWLIMAGRGWGKTRAGAEWVTQVARRTGRYAIACVGATMDEARRVMVEGKSGLLACADRLQPPRWEPSLARLTYPSGVRVQLFSADNWEALRGPEHRYAWCDELGKWAGGGKPAWDNLQLTMRDGDRPRTVVTTTPRPTKLLKALLADPAVVRTTGRTENNWHLPDSFLAEMRALYGRSRLGRQELDGELLEEVDGALWSRALLDACLWPEGQPRPAPVRVVIGVDAPASERGDACGIVACGRLADGRAVVLADHSVTRPSPERWAAAAGAAALAWNADRIVAEANQGGDMVASVLRAHDPTLPVALVRASRGKAARAEPVQLLYAQGRVRHAGVFAALEDELCALTAVDGYQGTGSPDRADALVWALTELMLTPRAEPRVWTI